MVDLGYIASRARMVRHALQEAMEGGIQEGGTEYLWMEAELELLRRTIDLFLQGLYGRPRSAVPNQNKLSKQKAG